MNAAGNRVSTTDRADAALPSDGSDRSRGAPCTLSVGDLMSTRWTFGSRDGPVLTDQFRFGASGAVENYRHDNEASWKLNGATLEIYQRSGRLMWTSERMFRDTDGRHFITLTTTIDPAVEFVLAEYRAPLSTADYLFPKDLQVTPTNLNRVLLVGSCLTELYHKEFSKRFPVVKFDRILFNFAGDMPEAPPSPVAEYDFQYVQIPLRSVVSDRIMSATRFNEPGFAEEILADGLNVIDVMLASAMTYNQAHGLLTFVCNFFVPQMSAAPSLRGRHKPVDLTSIVRKLNEYLAEAVDKHKNAYLIDVNAIGDSIGKQHFLDDMIYFYSHGDVHLQPNIDLREGARIEPVPPMSEFYASKRDDFIQAIYDQMISMYRTVQQTDQVKAVVFDLDNTLWRGQLAEHYRPEHNTWPPADGWPMGIWEAIHHLRSRGILVAICSKNDQKTVEALWSNAVRPELISLNDFTVAKINWLPKAENIRAICDDFSIKAKSVVFVDDNPVERAAVKAALPDIRVIGSNPYLTRRILLWAPETQVATVTSESARREDMIRKQIVREETRATMTREQFLATLGCTLKFTEIVSVDQPQFGRALELINKTNQFNTTGKRWSHAEMSQFLNTGGALLAFTVTDRFADYGLVGVLLLQELNIVQFVMSCRVLGMEVERSAVVQAVTLIRGRYTGVIRAPLQHTQDNMPCRDVYAKSGLTAAEEEDGSLIFVLTPAISLAMPPHVKIADPA
jgi:FkbH-like protein